MEYENTTEATAAPTQDTAEGHDHQGKTADPTVLVVSKVKAYANTNNVRCSAAFIASFNDFVLDALDRAIKRTKGRGRRTMTRSDA